MEISWVELRLKIKELWYNYIIWNMSFEEAEKEAKTYIDEVNKRSEQIAKEYGKKYRPITFANTCR